LHPVANSPAYETDQGTVLLIHALPNAPVTGFAGRHGDALKVRLAAPPSEGAANEALRRFLAEQFRLRQADVLLLSGGHSRPKRMLLKGLRLAQVHGVLDRVLSSKTKS
jgi:uncharacterized protein (TIGR00251 family)